MPGVALKPFRTHAAQLETQGPNEQRRQESGTAAAVAARVGTLAESRGVSPSRSLVRSKTKDPPQLLNMPPFYHLGSQVVH